MTTDRSGERAMSSFLTTLIPELYRRIEERDGSDVKDGLIDSISIFSPKTGHEYEISVVKKEAYKPTPRNRIATNFSKTDCK
jgi:hypothetical protein